MSRAFSTDYLIEVAKGSVSGASTVQKFGMNYAIGTTFVPISVGGIYRTPQVASATTLRVKAGGNANDTSAGTGARTIYLEGLDETGALVNETLTTAGASASTASTTTFLRLFRAYVATSGTYATSTTGSHSAAITIENGAGGTDWAIIYATGFPHSQTEIGAYSVPLGKTAYILDYRIGSDSTKSFDYLFFKREGILDTAAPYKAMRVQFEGVGVNSKIFTFPDPVKFPELTDIGFLAKVSAGTAQLTCAFNILLVDN